MACTVKFWASPRTEVPPPLWGPAPKPSVLFWDIFSSIYLEFPLLKLQPPASQPVQEKSDSVFHTPSQQLSVDSERQDFSRLNKPTSLLVHHGLQPLTLVARSSMTMTFLYRRDQNWTQWFRCHLSRCCAQGNNHSTWPAAPGSSAQDGALKIRQLTENYLYGQLHL